MFSQKIGQMKKNGLDCCMQLLNYSEWIILVQVLLRCCDWDRVGTTEGLANAVPTVNIVSFGLKMLSIWWFTDFQETYSPDSVGVFS